jgi:hypothetical protein
MFGEKRKTNKLFLEIKKGKKYKKVTISVNKLYEAVHKNNYLIIISYWT